MRNNFLGQFKKKFSEKLDCQFFSWISSFFGIFFAVKAGQAVFGLGCSYFSRHLIFSAIKK